MQSSSLFMLASKVVFVPYNVEKLLHAALVVKEAWSPIKQHPIWHTGVLVGGHKLLVEKEGRFRFEH